MSIDQNYIEKCLFDIDNEVKINHGNDLIKFYLHIVKKSSFGAFIMGNADPTDGIKYSLETQAEVYSIIYNYNIQLKTIVCRDISVSYTHLTLPTSDLV